MTTMTRTDIHRPSAVEFDPEDYEVFGYADFHESEGSRPVETVSRLVSEGWSFSAAPHGSGQCSHCGARLRYAALLGHTPTKTLLYVGETCLDNRFSLTASEFARMRKEAAAKAEQTRVLGRANIFFDQHPGLAYITYAHNISVAGGVEIAYDYYEGTEFATEAEALAAGVSPHALGIGYKRGTTWDEKVRMGKWTSILSDMSHKVTRYGDLSDKQIAFAQKIMGYLTEAEEKRVEREAATEATVAAGVKVPTGRQVIEGTVLSTKWVNNDFGGSLKMLVQHESGWKVWGSVPSSIDVEKDTRVRFTATVEPSADDVLFGFFKRPTKAEVL